MSVKVTGEGRIAAVSKPRLRPAVILVADRTLSARYKILFEGIFATMQTTHVPEWAMRRFVSPPMNVNKDGRAHAAALGIRRIESALLAHTELTPRDVVCTTPEALPDLMGEWVKVVLVSSSDPLGMGMSNTTTTQFWKGELYTRFWTNQMMRKIRHAKEKFGFKVVGGGAGAWQWVKHPDQAERQGFDIIFEGYFETIGPKFISDLLRNQQTESHIRSHQTAVSHTKPIRGASLLGIVELSRGCGKGCNFCTMATRKMEHLPADTILADLHTNIAHGITSVVSGSEDFFRYGGNALKPDFNKLHDLLVEMRKIRELSFMQIDHGNIATILQFTDEQLIETRRLLTWRKNSDYLWVNMGIESANGFLVQANSTGKIPPFRPDDWEEMVRQTADKMTRCGFFSVFSIILGLPGETPDDVNRTLKLIKYLTTKRTVIFPVFYEPYQPDSNGNYPRFTLEKMRPDHLELYTTCYEQNFKWVPPLYWDNQWAGGVAWRKRMLIRMLGKLEMSAWRRAFVRVGKQIENNKVLDPVTSDEIVYAKS